MRSMSDETISRRNFIAGVATTGTVASLPVLVDAQTAASSKDAVVVANYPVVEARSAQTILIVPDAENPSSAEERFSAQTIFIVLYAENLSSAEEEQIR